MLKGEIIIKQSPGEYNVFLVTEMPCESLSTVSDYPFTGFSEQLCEAMEFLVKNSMASQKIFRF